MAERHRKSLSRAYLHTKERIRKRHRQAAASMENRSLRSADTARKAHRSMAMGRGRVRTAPQTMRRRRLLTHTTGRSSRRPCPVSRNLSFQWTALPAEADGSRCGMKAAAAHASMTRPSTRRPRATTRSMRTPRAASGTPSAASRLWREDPSTKTASLFTRTGM